MAFREDTFVNDVQAAEILGFSKQTLRNWRCQCRGPAYSKTGRSVRYLVGDLQVFMNQNKIQPEAM